MIPVLFEDAYLVIINKPSGMVVNRATTVVGETVQDWVEKHYPLPHFAGEAPVTSINSDKSYSITFDDFIARSGVVHRLDKETSGCLVIARTFEAFISLLEAFKERTVKKSYIALAHGKIEPKTGSIDAPVGRLPWNRERFGVDVSGKEARTDYVVAKYYQTKDGEILTLVELYPTTGRTHQIRVHLKYINHPIVGDYLYGGRKQSRRDRLYCPRVFLHAASISIPHPITHTVISVQAPLPPELEKIVEQFSLVEI